MAFSVTGWYRTSVSMNSESVTNYTTGIVSPREQAMAFYGYVSAVDTVATILTAGYFTSRASDLAPGDFINVQGTDGSVLLKVTFVRVVNDSLIAPSVLYTIASNGAMLTSDITIPTAGVLTLNTVPVTVAPAVVGYKALYLGGFATLVFNATPYTFAGNLVWGYAGNAAASATIAATLLTAGATSSASSIPVSQAVAAEATFSDLALVFRASAAITVGDSPVNVRTLYTYVPSP